MLTRGGGQSLRTLYDFAVKAISALYTLELVIEAARRLALMEGRSGTKYSVMVD
jgi:hypothetical protein